METLFIGGVHGVGKSTVIKYIQQLENNVGHFSFGEIGRKYALETGMISDPKQVSTLTSFQRKILVDYVTECFRKLKKSGTYNRLLTDSHFSLYHNDKLIPLINTMDTSVFDKFALLQIPYQELYKRVVSDTKVRLDYLLNKDLVESHMEFERKTAHSISFSTAKQLLIIDNYSVELSVSEVIRFMKE